MENINIKIEKELDSYKQNHQIAEIPEKTKIAGLYEMGDMEVLLSRKPIPEYSMNIQTLDDLLDRDKQRENDGFPRRIRLGKFMKPAADNKKQIVVVPTTTEPKFYHDDRISEDDEQSTGGSGEGEEGEVIGEQEAEPQQGEGEGQGAGQGKDSGHEIGTDTFNLGKMLTEKFTLPNLKEKGKKRSISKYTYDLTDKNRGFGQFLDKKNTLQQVLETNILLGNIKQEEDGSFTGLGDNDDFLIDPHDSIYRILSPEKDFENQAVVFFIRDYSGSMQGKPTEVIATLHLFIYSWLVYQYKAAEKNANSNVVARFILHDTTAKEVPDFYTYYKSQVAGGTNIYPAYELVCKIVEEERLAKDNNIYVFHGTDGDDWEEDGKQLIENANKILTFANRFGITVAKNSWGSNSNTIVEKNFEKSGLLRDKPNLIRLDAFPAEGSTEARIIECIRKLIG